jgi:hypothetical protein
MARGRAECASGELIGWVGACRYRTVFEGVVRGPPLPHNGTGPIPDDSFNLWPGVYTYTYICLDIHVYAHIDR